jgi:hypothetical protein
MCSFVCCVLFERGVLFCVLCLIVVPLPPGETPFAVQLNNNTNNMIMSPAGLGTRNDCAGVGQQQS